MKLPITYNDDILGYNAAVVPDEVPRPATAYSLIDPPIGFFPFFGHGNGDNHGYYWPIGREDGPPIVACSSHDVRALIPENSSVVTLHACTLARSAGAGSDDGEDEDDDELGQSLEGDYAELVSLATGRPPLVHDLRAVAYHDYDQLLTLDPTSPFYLCAAGDVHLSRNETAAAERRYRESLAQLPEYVAAHFGLANVLRRERRVEEAAVHLRQALLGPSAFYGGSFWAETSLPGNWRNDWIRKALMWLQRTPTRHASLVVDPLINHIQELTFQTGLAKNSDIDVLQQIVEEYVAAEAFADAARVWQLIGERAALETISFRERYRLTPSTFGNRLAELFELARNIRRAALVRNMLASMENPDGLHL